jgi:hypothetical protein
LPLAHPCYLSLPNDRISKTLEVSLPADHPDFFSKGTQTGGFDLSQGKPFMNLLQVKLRMKKHLQGGLKK